LLALFPQGGEGRRDEVESGANVIDELQREYDDLKRRAIELRSFL
jgi:hypothetical protein